MSTRAEEGMKAGFSLQLAMFDDQVVSAVDVKRLSSMKARGVRDDDIYLCTYPKSGKSRVRIGLQQPILAVKGDLHDRLNKISLLPPVLDVYCLSLRVDTGYNWSSAIHVCMIPWLVDLVDTYHCIPTHDCKGSHWTWEIINMVIAGKAQYVKHWMNVSCMEIRMEEDFDDIPSPRILQSHHRPSILPRQISERKCRVINVQRNPKDVAVSFYKNLTHQDWIGKTNVPAFTGSWESFLDSFMKGNVPYDSVFDHMLAWDKFPEEYPDVPFHQVQFEDLKRDNVKEVKRLAEFLCRPLSDKVCEEIADACNFSNLKQASVNKDPTHQFPWIDGSSGVFRTGETGGWKNWFSVAQSERFDRIYEQKYHRLF